MTKSKTPFNLDPKEKGSLGAIVGKNKDGTIKAGNAEKIANDKKDPKTGKYKPVKINGKEKKVTGAIKKKATFYENIVKK